MKRKGTALWGGVLIGVLNGLMGAGGGMLTVPLLERMGVAGKKSHATALCVILPLSLASAAVYWRRGWFSPADARIYLPGGILGAFAGGKLMKKLPVGWLKLAFGLLLLWAGVGRLTG